DAAGAHRPAARYRAGRGVPGFRRRRVDHRRNAADRRRYPMSASMRVMRVTRAKGPFELVEQPIPAPGPGRVRLKVEACGLCHSDSITKEAILPGIEFPRAPGHEVAGVVDAVGAGVTGWSAGQRAGVGWH